MSKSTSTEKSRYAPVMLHEHEDAQEPPDGHNGGIHVPNDHRHPIHSDLELVEATAVAVVEDDDNHVIQHDVHGSVVVKGKANTTASTKAAAGAPFRVVAPTAMLEGYRFVVAYGPDTVLVEVPTGCGLGGCGYVHEGQVFVPEVVKRADDAAVYPVAGRWNDRLCDCFHDISWLGGIFFSFYFLPAFLGRVQDRLKGRIMSSTIRSKWCLLSASFLIAMFIPGMIHVWILVLAYFVYRVRRQVRAKYAIPTSWGSSVPPGYSDFDVEDCLTSFCCTCCTILQMYRHTKDSVDIGAALRGRNNGRPIGPDDEIEDNPDAVKPGKMDPSYIKAPSADDSSTTTLTPSEASSMNMV